jgi:hypothetical protein
MEKRKLQISIAANLQKMVMILKMYDWTREYRH